MTAPLAVEWVCVCPGAWGCSEDCEQTVNSSCRLWREGGAACQDAQLRARGCCAGTRRAGRPSATRCVLGSALVLAPLGGDALAPPGEESRAEPVLMQGRPGACRVRYRTAFPPSSLLLSSRRSVLNSCLSCRRSPLDQQHLPALGALHQRHQPGGLQLQAGRHAPALLLRLQRGPVERGRGYPRQLPQPL